MRKRKGFTPDCQRFGLALVMTLFLLAGCSPSGSQPVATLTQVSTSAPAPTFAFDTPTPTPDAAATRAAYTGPRLGVAVVIDKPEIVRSLNISGSVDLTVFQNAIPQEWMTPPGDWPQYQFHFHLVPAEIEACKYDGGIGTYPITVSRLVPNLEVKIVDDQSGRNLASNLFVGQPPEQCKSTESFTKNETGGYNGGALVGALADSKLFADWLTATVTDLKLDLPPIQ